MSGIESQLAEQIEAAIRTSGADGPNPAARPALGELLAAASSVLGHPVPDEVREAALALNAFAHADAAGDTYPPGFCEALVRLRDALARSASVAVDDGIAQFVDDPELVQEFLVEAREHLVSVEAGLLTLEQDPEDAEALNSVFRSFHSIKGVAGFLGATSIHELAHETENLLDLARSGKLHLSQPIIDLILRSADDLTKCLDRANSQPLSSLPRCDTGLLAALAAVTQGIDVGPEIPVPAARDKAVAGGSPAPPEGALSPDQSASDSAPVPKVETAGVQVRSVAENSVVRIETAKLEYLIDMVGELVIAESVVRHDPGIAASADPLLSRNLTQLARVVQEVQKTSMSMRMVAIGTLFRKMSRLTRDLARKSAKNVELVTVGDDVELDRSIVEDLADPMVHMIRNAVDHGLEMPGDRVARGKSERGTVRLQAMHDAGDIVIEIADDGRGMDPERILAKARRVGLVGEHESPDEETIFRLIFEAGFSTADKVTDMSGRGVGMDVVKKQIQKLRGRISIRSVLGKGCSFVLRLPLTLAIIDGLVVGVGSQRFILPMFAVREMFSPRPDTFVMIENRAEAAFYRNKLLPVIRLSHLFELRKDGTVQACPQPLNDAENAARKSRMEGVLIVVEGRDQLYCIAVDQLIGKQEVVIKSLGKTFRDVPAVSGGAILGDGRVGLIIDVNSLKYPK